MTYFELNKIDKKEFDRDTTILLENGSMVFGDDTFHTYDDLILAAQNNYMITLGFSAIVLDSSLQKAGIKNAPNDHSDIGQLRSLVYMIRCAFAHDMMYPYWNVKGPYQRQIKLNLKDKNLMVDLTALDNKIFDVSHIGGIKGYTAIKEEVLKIIKMA